MGELLIDELTELVIGCAIAVHTTLGPGLLESIYKDCLFIELTLQGIQVSREHPVPIEYRGRRVRDDLKIDLFIDGRLVVEVKVADRLHPVHQAQVITYLKLTGCPAGLLLNFNATSLRAGLKRLDHPAIYAEKLAAKRAQSVRDRVHE
jgi:GxxExxY protein